MARGDGWKIIRFGPDGEWLECVVDDCAAPRYSRGMCTKHYSRDRTERGLETRATGTPESFWALTRKGCGFPSEPNSHYRSSMGECWLWGGPSRFKDKAKQREYGLFSYFDGKKNRLTGAHRYAYTDTHGSIPSGLDIDHMCRNTMCVNPEHLEPVTTSENTLRSVRHLRAKSLPIAA